MSDTSKATPRPWGHGDAYHNPGKGEDIFVGSDGTVVATTGDIGGFIREADADLVLAAVNSYNPERDRLALELAWDINERGSKHYPDDLVRKAHQLLKLYEEESGCATG